VAFEKTRSVTDVTVLPAGRVVLNMRSARRTLADARTGFVVPKLFEGSEESTYESAVGVNISEVSAKTELFWRGMKRRNADNARTSANRVNFPAGGGSLISTRLPFSR
jgi:hypothetical protein